MKQELVSSDTPYSETIRPDMLAARPMRSASSGSVPSTPSARISWGTVSPFSAGSGPALGIRE